MKYKKVLIIQIIVILIFLIIGCTNENISQNNEVDNMENEENEITQNENETDVLKPYKDQSKWGYKDSSDEIIIEAKFDLVEDFKNGLAKVEVDGVTGRIDKEGNFIIEDSLSRKKLMPKKIIDKYGYINDKNEIVIKPQYNDAKEFSEGLAAVLQEGKWGYIDNNDEIIIKPQFDDVGMFNENLAPVRKDGDWGYIDKNGDMIIEAKFDEAKEINEGLAPVKEKGGWGYINKNGELIIDTIFEDAKKFNEGLAPVCEGNDWGFINDKGEYKIKPQYYKVEQFSEGLAYIIGGPNVGSGFIDSKGNMIIKDNFNKTYPFENGKAKIVEDGYTGYIDKSGNYVVNDRSELIPKKIGHRWGYVTKVDNLIAISNDYEEANRFIDGIALVKKNDGFAYINKKGDILVDELTQAYDFQDGKGLARKNNEWVYYNNKGEKINIDYNNGLAEIEIGDKKGFINTDGKIVSEDINELSLWEYKGKYGYVDQDNNIIVTPKYYEATEIKNGIGLIKGNNDWFNLNWGYINKNGEELFEPQFEKVTEFNDKNVAAVMDNGKWGYVNKNGEFVIGLVLNNIEKFKDGKIKITIDNINGYINSKGELIYDKDEKIIPHRFNLGHDKYKYGYITENDNKMAVVPEYDFTGEFNNGLSLIKKGDYLGFMDSKGQIKLKPQFSKIRNFKNGMAAVEKDSKWGFIDQETNLVIKRKYDYVNDFSNDKAKVIKDGKYSFVNKNGELINEFNEVQPFEDYKNMKFENIDELLKVINNNIYSVEQHVADQMIADLIIRLRDETLDDYSEFKREGKYTKNLFNYYIEDKSSHLRGHGVFIDFKKIQEIYGSYLSKRLNNYLNLRYEMEDEYLIGDGHITISIKDLAKRILKYEDFIKNNQEFSLTNEIYEEFVNAIRIFINPTGDNMTGQYINGSNQPKEELEEAYNIIINSNYDAPITKETVKRILDSIDQSEDNSFDNIKLGKLRNEVEKKVKDTYR